MASIEKRGSSLRAIIRLPGGEKLTETFDNTPEGAKAARVWSDLQERKKKSGQLSNREGDRHTVGQMFEVYLDDVAAHTDTAKWNRIRLLAWAETPLGRTRLTECSPADVNRWARARLDTPIPYRGHAKPAPPLRYIKESTLTRELSLMSAAFTYAVKSLRWIDMNPCHDAEKFGAAIPRNRPLLSPEELAALRVSSGYRDDAVPETDTARVGAAFFLALETGMRSGEILRLKPADYDRDRCVVVVTASEPGGRKGSKSGKRVSRREVPLTKTAIGIVDRLLQSMPEDQVAGERLLNPPYIVGVRDSSRDALWRKIRNRAAVKDLTFHDTKHEAATRLSKHIDVIALSHAIGTKDVRLLRDTYYLNDAEGIAKTQLPDKLSVHA